jgi:uncharacterized repeat protein (TIGR03803 family)
VGSDGALYGITSEGGAFTNQWLGLGAGTVFRLQTDGSEFSILHSFGNTGDDMQNPEGGLFEGSDDALYGTTSAGPGYSGGTVFKIRKDGTGYSRRRHS